MVGPTHCRRLASSQAALRVVLAVLLGGFVCLSAAARADGTLTAQLPGPEDEVAWQSPPGPFATVEPALLSLYKTVTYTAMILTTDQLWYVGVAAQAATTSGTFAAINVVTSPLLSYAFEYAWEQCCQAPPGPDGVRPVDAEKAAIYRVVSTARIFGLALLLGNGFSSSLLTTTAIAATRTVVYMVNEVIWNRLTAAGVTAPPPPGLALNN
jgi:uncharacterized membrane protein